jgi:hypothetical protein
MANKDMYFEFENGEICCFNFYPSGDYKKLSVAEGKRLYAEQCAKELRKFIQPGQTVYINFKSVSASGMSRQCRCYVVRNGEIVDITFRVAKILDWRLNDRHNLVVAGCGMDMGFHTVYCLSEKLFSDDRNGYTLKHANI